MQAELAAQKLRYESRVNLISEELQSSQSQMSRFKRERDAYRHMVEEAQNQPGKDRPASLSVDEVSYNRELSELPSRKVGK